MRIFLAIAVFFLSCNVVSAQEQPKRGGTKHGGYWYTLPTLPSYGATKEMDTPSPIGAKAARKGGLDTKQRDWDKKFWDFTPEFTPKIEQAIKGALNFREQQFKHCLSRELPAQPLCRDAEDLKNLLQSDKKLALLYFLTESQSRYEQQLREDLRTSLAQMKANKSNVAAMKEIKKLQAAWGN